VKFTPKGGTVRVTLARGRSSWQIQVSDTGIGIGPELLPYVFDRFRQADSSARRKFGGLGLGLSIVKHIVEQHGGTIQAHSAGEGRGSTFTVVLPIKAVRIGEGGGTQGAEGEPPGGAEGAETVGGRDAQDGAGDAPRVPPVRLDAAEALKMLRKVRPDVLVSDLGMPDVDGLDLIRAVRGRGHHARDLPAVALSAFVQENDQRQALLAGFQVHVPKPVDPYDLTSVIAGLVGRTE
jgi:CheY-like chemotaxis protein